MSRIHPHRTVWGLVPAGGRGQRFGGETPKQFISIHGRPLLAWTVERLLDAGLSGVTIALPEEWLSAAAEILPVEDRVVWVPGGATRQLSVAACLTESPTDADLVLVHDGARPAVATEDLMATIDAVDDADGAVLGRPLADTIKRVDDGQITSTLDRSHLFRAETPQVFRRAILDEALRRSAADGFVGTDEAAIVERLPGVNIQAVAAMRPNPKLTQRRDLPLVEMLLGRKGES